MAPQTPAPPDPGSLEAVLRPTESIKAIAECRLRTSAGRFHAEAVVLENSSSRNESGVLVFVPPTDDAPIKILHALPITSSFSASLQQTPPSPSSSFFAQSSKPNIELVLDRGVTNAPKIELQFAPSQSYKVQTIMKAIRKAVDVSFPWPDSHSWLAFYPEAQGNVAPDKTDDETRIASLEASFGKLDASDSDTSASITPATQTPQGITANLESDNDKDQSMVDISLDTPADPIAISGLKEAIARRKGGSAKEEEVETKDDVNKEDEAKEDTREDESDKFPNPYAPRFSRTAFLRKRMFSRQEKWSSTKDISIRVVTYNVNDRVPPPGTKELSPIVGPGRADIIALGLQEVDLRSSALFVSQGVDRATSWEKAIFEGLGDKKEDYVKVASVQYVGVLLIIVVCKELHPHITALQESSRGIGLLGVGGNKAGVSVRLKIHDTTITFITSHLAAFANQLERRRYDYLTLRTGLNFPLPTDVNPALEAYYPETNRLLSIDDCDVCFWSGDLNYRLDMSDQEIWDLVEGKHWDGLLLGDQLLSDISENMSFAGFSEPPITFRPTFKYVHGSVTLDPKRAPAYTDRVLHLSRGLQVTSTEYVSHELLWSDHLPVSSTYTVPVRVVDETKRGEELVLVQCELDKLDELYRASLAIDKDELDFGAVKYHREVKRELVLRNTGRVPATFSFRVPSPGKPICKPWFWPFPSSGVVQSGHEFRITVTSDVDQSQCLSLTCGEEMNDVLVLQVAGGKESFISLRAQFEPTIIGFPLEHLPMLSNDIRNVPLAERKKLVSPPEDDPFDADDDQPKNSKPPREVWRLLEQLIADGGDVEKLWTDEINLPAMLDVLEALDTGAKDIPGTPKDAAQTLLHILYALPTPLVPESQRAACQAANDRYAAFNAVEKVPSIHANVLIGLMSVAKLCAGVDKPVDDASVRVLATAVFGGSPAGREGFIRALIEG